MTGFLKKASFKKQDKHEISSDEVDSAPENPTLTRQKLDKLYPVFPAKKNLAIGGSCETMAQDFVLDQEIKSFMTWFMLCPISLYNLRQKNPSSFY